VIWWLVPLMRGYGVRETALPAIASKEIMTPHITHVESLRGILNAQQSTK